VLPPGHEPKELISYNLDIKEAGKKNCKDEASCNKNTKLTASLKINMHDLAAG